MSIEREKLEKALSAWVKWYSARLARINGGAKEDYTGYEQDLFEALGCSVSPVSLQSMREPLLTTYIEDLDKVDPENTAEFYRLIKLGVILLQLTIEDITDKFQISKTSARRWLDEVTCPHPAMRTHIYKWLSYRAIQVRDNEK